MIPMFSKEEAYLKIEELVTRFREQLEDYKRPEYNETLTRRDFLDPFFKALGWDVDNSQGFAEAYREVIHEDRVRIGKATKAPDYSFRLPGGKRLFFVEAKKPSVVLRLDTSVAYQIRRYGWSAKLAISIITDFEEFAVFDCTVKPQSSDNASVARIKYLRFTEYLKEFDFLWDTFSKERVLKGSFDRYIGNDSVKKGTTTVDKAFLASLDAWRTYLATNISLQNKELDEDEINYAVQLTIDRLIFLRISEDREIEPYGQLRASANQKGEVWQNLFYNFRKADEKYNSGLFDLKKDRITPGLTVDNKVIKTIVNEMYYPDCPYEFSVFSVEILGSAYEQFLGKVIRIDQAHRAKIEEKPEVRKAGGVYYTPQYIVDYIVKNTVGKLVEGKNPAEITEIKIVDPACGSGSFLIGAYQYLLDYHKKYYAENRVKAGKKESPITPEGNLTSAEKKRILLNNIYGVDIDVNAVEVTKLSLLLKCLEGETETSIVQQQHLWHERILPTLDNNIKSGNSLIDIDFYSTQLDFGEEKKIKPFNWQKAFPEVSIKQGFNVVLGNPPYVRQELLGNQKTYFERHYRVYHGMADLYSYFIEKGIRLLKTGGLFGIIVANKWMRSNYGEPLRKWMKEQSIHQIIDFGDLPVFESATTYPCILIAGKPDEENFTFRICQVKTLKFCSLEEYVDQNWVMTEKQSLDNSGWNLSGAKETELLNKIKNRGIPLGEYVKGKIYRGVLTGLNEAFVIDLATRDRLIAEDPKSAEVIKPFLAGRDIKRYQAPESEKFLIFTRRGIKVENYQAIKNHLLQFQKQLAPKPKNFTGDNWEGRKPGKYQWYEIQDAVDYYPEFENVKIIIPAIVKSASYTLDLQGYYSNDKTSIISTNDLYILGLLNSKCLDFYLKSLASTKQGGYFEYKPMYVSKIPIKIADESSEKGRRIKSEIEIYVNQILNLNLEKSEVKVPSKQEQIQNKIDFCEERINQLVYKLYDLTEEEINLIEENLRKKV